jgi:hypothetical protein
MSPGPAEPLRPGGVQLLQQLLALDVHVRHHPLHPARELPGAPPEQRHCATLASCAYGGHAIWWEVEAATETAALALLPFYVAERATATRVSEVDIP